MQGQSTSQEVISDVFCASTDGTVQRQTCRVFLISAENQIFIVFSLFSDTSYEPVPSKLNCFQASSKQL